MSLDSNFNIFKDDFIVFLLLFYGYLSKMRIIGITFSFKLYFFDSPMILKNSFIK